MVGVHVAFEAEAYALDIRYHRRVGVLLRKVNCMLAWIKMIVQNSMASGFEVLATKQ